VCWPCDQQALQQIQSSGVKANEGWQNDDSFFYWLCVLAKKLAAFFLSGRETEHLFPCQFIGVTIDEDYILSPGFALKLRTSL
jgi:hypothetical protein